VPVTKATRTNPATAIGTRGLAASNSSFCYRPTYTGTLANGGVALAPYHELAGRVGATLRAELAKIEEKIETGQIVPATRSPV
jgi:basic membrane protein A